MIKGSFTRIITRLLQEFSLVYLRRFGGLTKRAKALREKPAQQPGLKPRCFRRVHQVIVPSPGSYESRAPARILTRHRPS